MFFFVMHMLRVTLFYNTQAARLMLKTALYDEDDKVRYEALLQYQAHPKAAMAASKYKDIG